MENQNQNAYGGDETTVDDETNLIDVNFEDSDGDGKEDDEEGHDSLFGGDLNLQEEMLLMQAGQASDDELFSMHGLSINGGAGDDLLGSFMPTGDITLNGGAGNDFLAAFTTNSDQAQLNGGAGNDVFMFGPEQFGGMKFTGTIDDFQQGQDHIMLSGLNIDLTVTNGAEAVGAGAQLVFDGKVGALYYDADGAGAGQAVELGVVHGTDHLAASDFMTLG